MRRFVHPGLRTALDEFSAPLFWGEDNWESADPPFTPAVPGRENHWCPEVMRWLLPMDVAVLHHFWTEIELDAGPTAAPQKFVEGVDQIAGQLR